MNLQGKMVKFHMFDEMDEINNVDRSLNNYQNTCPALVLTDWSSNTDNCVSKALNLRVFPDCGDSYVVTSAMHVEISGTYPSDPNDPNVQKDIVAKKNCWEMY